VRTAPPAARERAKRPRRAQEVGHLADFVKT